MCVRVRAEPDFVGSALVRESSGSKNGDDDKIYFFFSEQAVELDCDTEPIVARVARVCKVTPSFTPSPDAAPLASLPVLLPWKSLRCNIKSIYQ